MKLTPRSCEAEASLPTIMLPMHSIAFVWALSSSSNHLPLYLCLVNLELTSMRFLHNLVPWGFLMLCPFSSLLNLTLLALPVLAQTLPALTSLMSGTSAFKALLLTHCLPMYDTPWVSRTWQPPEQKGQTLPFQFPVEIPGSQLEARLLPPLSLMEKGSPENPPSPL